MTSLVLPRAEARFQDFADCLSMTETFEAIAAQ
jgi:hypothetical protein